MNRMHQLLLDAAASHPERAEYDRAVANGVDPERAAKLLSSQEPLTLHAGASTWRVQNNPMSLEAHATAVAKCPGFNGRKTPRPRAPKGGGATYMHADGFRLFVPQGMVRGGGKCQITIGTHAFTLHHDRRTITGAVPESWLIDLNAGPIEVELDHEEPVDVSDLL